MRVKHLIAKLINCRINEELFSNEKFIGEICDKIVEKLKMKFIDKLFFKFKPHGLSMIYLIAESHIAIHTWPEYKFVDVEIVSCKEDSNVFDGLSVCVEYFKPEKVESCYWE
jgi:S-adenosylmethionine decarboxylase